jgi:hypothetical protein
MQNRSLKISLFLSMILNFGIQTAASQAEVANVLDLLHQVYKVQGPGKHGSGTSGTGTQGVGTISSVLVNQTILENKVGVFVPSKQNTVASLPFRAVNYSFGASSGQSTVTPINNKVIFVKAGFDMDIDHTQYAVIEVPMTNATTITPINFLSVLDANGLAASFDGFGHLKGAILPQLSTYDCIVLEFFPDSTDYYMANATASGGTFLSVTSLSSFGSFSSSRNLSLPANFSCTAPSVAYNNVKIPNGKIVFVTTTSNLTFDSQDYLVIEIPKGTVFKGNTFTAFSIKDANGNKGVFPGLGDFEFKLNKLTDNNFIILQLLETSSGVSAYGFKGVLGN